MFGRFGDVHAAAGTNGVSFNLPLTRSEKREGAVAST
jgi:hypothetical protein